MPLSWNEIKSRALAFSKEWESEASENAEAKSFWDDFFHIFGISRRRVASFELPVKKLGDKQGFIDLFWKGVLLVEHKSRGRDLDKAHTQALDYFPGLKEHELPRYVLVSDFARFRLHDLEEDTSHEFALADLHQNIQLFGFIAGYQTHKIQEQDPVNIEAAERMGKLHDQMREVGYSGHALEVYLVRLLFCLFAEDTGIFQRQQLQEYIEQRTREDGSDLALHLNALFETLNTPAGKRLKNLDEQLAAFPYINGKLFAELLPTASFDSAMRQSLLDCCGLDWGRISPAIFGSLFQSIMDKTARRNLGAHYTSEGNILKLIKPLFLDELRAEFERIKTNAKRLLEFQQKLRSLTFLDPACGCGNFLVIAYRELRLLELDVLRAARAGDQLALDVSSLILVDVDQFYGIEIEEFPAQIAQVALWLMDHQMNLQVSQEFGAYFARIPLHASGTIVHANALQLDWNEVIAADRLSYIMGNPPVLGKKEQSKEQKADFASVMGHIKSFGILDFVAAWYVKAANMMQNTDIRCAFVSTNSITQGEQVGVLWSWMLEHGVKIFFGHRTFAWSNEARGKAAVHCVIVGFSLNEIAPKRIFEYEDIKGESHELIAKNINPYLVNSADITINKRTRPISDVPLINKGSEATDFGHLFLEPHEMKALITEYPISEKWIRRAFGGDELINNITRYCLWLVDAKPNEIKTVAPILERIDNVRK
ncbi:MAG: class I SAM-dependent DNA methyltransferase, partial [Thiopseudomonas sp.]